MKTFTIIAAAAAFFGAANAVTISLPSGVSIPSGVTLPSGVTVVSATPTSTAAAAGNAGNAKRQIGGKQSLTRSKRQNFGQRTSSTAAAAQQTSAAGAKH